MPEVVKQVGDIIEISIAVDGADNFAACGFDLIYDSDYLEFIHASEGSYLNVSGAIATVFTADIAETPGGLVPGDLVVSISRINPADGAQIGDGELCTLQFKAVSFGTTSVGFSPAARTVYGIDEAGENFGLINVNWFDSDQLRIDAVTSLRIIIKG